MPQTTAASRLASPLGGEAASTASGEGQWRLVIEATQYVTDAVITVWVGTKPASNDPVGIYTKITGYDPVVSAFGLVWCPQSE